jgi:beta-glucosidase
MNPGPRSPSVATAAVLGPSTPDARAQQETTPPAYRNSKLPVEQRVQDLLARMTLEEKLDLLSGTGFESKPNPRLGIPAIRMADGPQGVRIKPPKKRAGSGRSTSGLPVPATAFPAGIALAATWDPELIQRVGRALGQETRALNKDMLLAPCVNIQRVPHGGRNFESFGEDPYLASRTAVAFIQGVQRQGVIATVKHFAANNQECKRKTINVEAAERALHEIYFPAFQAAVQEAGVWSVMSAYNKLNGAWCSENRFLLTDVLKNLWGFQGFVVSDWGGVHTAVKAVNAGLDIEMPRGQFLNRRRLLPAVASGQVRPAVIDDPARRILRAMFSIGLFDRPGSQGGAVDTPERRAVARAAATESIVLLKNTGELLPLLPRKIRSIAVIGPNANEARVGGGGSAMVRPTHAVSPLEGIRSRAGTLFELGYALGCKMARRSPCQQTRQTRADLVNQAVGLASRTDVAIVFAGDSAGHESEGFDRKSLDLPAGQDELIVAVANANPNTVVVLNVGAPVLMGRWIDRVPAVLNAWFGGEEVGHAIAAVLFGDANPSGKLPVTLPKDWKDSPAYGRYPGRNGSVDYGEGLYVGYRHFDKHNIEPRFPFGHGLSYTRFEYRALEVSPTVVAPNQPVHVRLSVRNAGAHEGAEVVQLYVRDVECRVDRPVKELKAFRRIVLQPGETRPVSFTLDPHALAFYHATQRAWVTEPGKFEVLAGASSRDIRLRAMFELAN